MYRTLSHLLPLCFLVTACGSSARHQSLLERREAIRASNAEHEAAFIETYRSRDGFQDTRWGMSPEEVKALYPGASMVSTKGDMRARLRVVDRPAIVSFFFTQDKLAIITVQFASPDPLRDEFSALSELLGMKYGTPTSRVDTAAEAEARLWNIQSGNERIERTDKLRELGSDSRRRSDDDPVEPRYRQDEEDARLEAVAARNDYSLQRVWRDSETELLLDGRQTPSHSTLSLQYESRVLRPYITEDLKVDSAQRKREQAGEL
ncbi:hypothetical protein ACLESD_03760 [Pyxidicoccus sp. 3LFB2]